MIPKKPISGFVHSIESLGTMDGPGLRTVIFLQGCPLKCKFCHNIDCSFQTESNKISSDKLVEKVLKDKSYWKSYDSNEPPSIPPSQGESIVKGGITISGGDPTFQPEFLLDILRRLKAENIHTAVDTCLMTSKETIDNIFPYVDLWMCSVKHTDEKQHQFLTSVSNKHILENLKYLDDKITNLGIKSQELRGKKDAESSPLIRGVRGVASNPKIRIRFLIIPGLTDSKENVEATADIVQNLKNLEAVEVLAYGSHGKYKWIDLFGKYELEGVPDATEKDTEKARKVFRALKIPMVSV